MAIVFCIPSERGRIMVLTVNIENTILTFGVFDDDRLSFSASIAASPNATAVSYTHLDVYKRQIQ